MVNKISKLLYQTATYGTPDYYGGINDPKIKKALNDATQRVYRQQQTSKEALDQACQEIDPLLAGPVSAPSAAAPIPMARRVPPSLHLTSGRAPQGRTPATKEERYGHTAPARAGDQSVRG